MGSDRRQPGPRPQRARSDRPRSSPLRLRIRRESFVSLGGFDSSFPLYEDVAMYLRAIRLFGFDFVGQVLLNRRTGEPSLIQNERDAERTHVSYRMMHDNYRKEFGLAEYAALKALSFTLPRSKVMTPRSVTGRRPAVAAATQSSAPKLSRRARAPRAPNRPPTPPRGSA